MILRDSDNPIMHLIQHEYLEKIIQTRGTRSITEAVSDAYQNATEKVIQTHVTRSITEAVSEAVQNSTEKIIQTHGTRSIRANSV